MPEPGRRAQGQQRPRRLTRMTLAPGHGRAPERRRGERTPVAGRDARARRAFRRGAEGAARRPAAGVGALRRSQRRGHPAEPPGGRPAAGRDAPRAARTRAGGAGAAAGEVRRSEAARRRGGLGAARGLRAGGGAGRPPGPRDLAHGRARHPGVDPEEPGPHGRHPVPRHGAGDPQGHRRDPRGLAAIAEPGAQAQPVVARAQVAHRGLAHRQQLRRGGAQAHGCVPGRPRLPDPSQDRPAAGARGARRRDDARSAAGVGDALGDPGFRARLVRRIRQRRHQQRRHRQPAPGRPAAVVRGRPVGLPRRRDPRHAAGHAAHAARRDAGLGARPVARRSGGILRRHDAFRSSTAVAAPVPAVPGRGDPQRRSRR